MVAEEEKALPSPSDGLKDFHTDFVAWLHAPHCDWYNENVPKIEASTGLKREHMAYGLAGLQAAYLVFGNAAEFVCNVTGFAYPAYVSVKAIRSPETADDTQWLVYWTVFAVFCLFDSFAASIMHVFPFYWVFKVMFLVYLYLPQTMGARVMYKHVVNPLVTAIDKAFFEQK